MSERGREWVSEGGRVIPSLGLMVSVEGEARALIMWEAFLLVLFRFVN